MHNCEIYYETYINKWLRQRKKTDKLYVYKIPSFMNKKATYLKYNIWLIETKRENKKDDYKNEKRRERRDVITTSNKIDVKEEGWQDTYNMQLHYINLW